MEKRAEFLIDYARAHGPMTVRGLYYQAEVAGIPGIEKTDAGYVKVQRQVLALRREGRLDYSDIADATRWMRKPTTYSAPEAAIRDIAKFYRKALWADTAEVVEIWVEKDALAGVLFPVTAEYDAPLMVTRGYSSETFAYEAVMAHEDEDRPIHIYYLGDFDRAGKDAANSLEEKLLRFAAEVDATIEFEQIAVTEEQIARWRLPTRPPKRNSPADRNWPHDHACELDAIPPDTMRELVRDVLEWHLPADQLRILKVAEASERQWLQELVT
jgi:hypothetical protein